MSQLPYIPYNSSNKDYASQNRKAMTPAEQRIWFEIFKNRLVGYKFIRQKMIQSFILDFYCAKLMLGVEIDGSSHDDKQYYDEVRSKLLRDFGIKIVRYTNTQIMKKLEGVFDDLIWQIKQREKEIVKLSI